MNRNFVARIVTILVCLGLAGYFIYPSLVFYAKPPEVRQQYAKKHPVILKKVFNLGLDLQGGMRIVLEVDRSKVDSKNDHDILDRAYTIIENRINALGVAEPTIQKQGKDRLIVELPGLKDEKAAKSVIGRTAQLEFKLLREPAQLERAIKVIDEALKGSLPAADTTDTALADDSTAQQKKEEQELAERLFTGTESAADTTAKAAAPVSAEDDLLEGVTSFKGLLARVGEVMIGATPENKSKIDAVLARTDVREALERSGLGGNQFLWGHDTAMVQGMIFKSLYYVKSHPEMRGDVIKDARHQMDQSGLSGGYKIDIEMNSKGARRFASVTGANVGKYMAIVLDSTIYSAPRIVQKIPLGRAEITGNFSLEQSNALAIVLRAGALPAPVKIIEERIVGPSLGQDSISKGLYAMIIGFILVAAFMILYYRLSGVFAVVALLLNTVMVLAIMAGIKQTLTLPGIAGLILNMGMAVDANVLVFERIREELLTGKTVRSAVSAGYSRAFLTIIDSNITTLITTFILMWQGTGPIKGFAVTLTFGIIVSLFTAVFVTKTIYLVMTNSRDMTRLSI